MARRTKRTNINSNKKTSMFEYVWTTQDSQAVKDAFNKKKVNNRLNYFILFVCLPLFGAAHKLPVYKIPRSEPIYDFVAFIKNKPSIQKAKVQTTAERLAFMLKIDVKDLPDSVKKLQ